MPAVVMFGNKPVRTCEVCGYVTIGEGAALHSICENCGSDFCQHPKEKVRASVYGFELVTYCAACGGMLGSEDRE